MFREPSLLKALAKQEGRRTAVGGGGKARSPAREPRASSSSLSLADDGTRRRPLTPDRRLARSAVASALATGAVAAPELLVAGHDGWKTAATRGWRRSSYKDEARSIIHEHVCPSEPMRPAARRISCLPNVSAANLVAQQQALLAKEEEKKAIVLQKQYKKSRGDKDASVMARIYSRDGRRNLISEHLQQRRNAEREREERAQERVWATSVDKRGAESTEKTTAMPARLPQ